MIKRLLVVVILVCLVSGCTAIEEKLKPLRPIIEHIKIGRTGPQDPWHDKYKYINQGKSIFIIGVEIEW